MSDYRGYRRCSWLMTGRNVICGKVSCEKYCKPHRQKIMQRSKIPLPCLVCGVGVRSEIQLCRGCGRERERYRLKTNNFGFKNLFIPLPCLCCGVTVTSYNQLCTRCEEKYGVEYK